MNSENHYSGLKTNKQFIQEWLPRFLGREVQDAKILPCSIRADYHVEYKYKKQVSDAEQWGENPDRLWTGGTHFTNKEKALQFIKECENSILES